MIKLELELAKCRERTKDEAVVLLMMQAKVDVLSETYCHRERDEMALWVACRKLSTNEDITARLPVRAA